MMTPEFGKWYTYKTRVVKVTEGKQRRLWRIPTDYTRKGICIGWRTLTVGTLAFDPGGETNYLKSKHYVKVCLFAVNARENPEWVLPEDVIEEATS